MSLGVDASKYGSSFIAVPNARSCYTTKKVRFFFFQVSEPEIFVFSKQGASETED